MKRIFKITFIIATLSLFLASCVKDLDKGPIDPNVFTSENVYTTPAGYKQVLAKVYAGLSSTGQQGPAGMPDLAGIDEGFSQYIRSYFVHQELPTDEAVICWNDHTIKDFHSQVWGSGDVFVQAMYYRIYLQISLCNEFIRESTDAKLDSRGITGTDKTNIQYYRAEARFMRALSYYHALDMFGNVPFVTENDKVEKFFPPQIKRADLFTYIENELKAIEPLMMAPKANEYGRADQACVWTLLAKLYLNATVYNGTDRNTDCITYCQKVMSGGYSLEPTYQNLFLADNNHSPEVIFPVIFDGVKTRNYGGTTFLTHAEVGGTMTPADYGVGGGWAGVRTTKSFVQKFYPNLTKTPWQSPRPPKHPNSYPVLYVPGSYQNPAWTPSNTTTVIASVSSNSKYEGYFWFPAGTNFKICPQPNWDRAWGQGTTDSTLSLTGGNISVANAGYYKLNFDTVTTVYKLTKTTWGIIGDATAGGWNTDTPMTYDSASGVWKVTAELTAANLKFRANGAWDINYGDATPANGTLVFNGANIAIPTAGKYDIVMKLGAPDYTYTLTITVVPSVDSRALFYTSGQSLDINDIGNFNDGWAVSKWKNVTSTGAAGSDLNYSDVDFPMFRLADVYLMYAEAVLRGGSGGDLGTALNVVNQVRTRAFGNTPGAITADQLTLAFILDERGRELYYECVRRTDLIRFGEFTTNAYLWPWKGGSKDGIATDNKYNIFPLPSSDVTANPNLVQNPGY